MVVSLEDLLAQADALRKEIDALQKLRDEIYESLNSVKSAKEAINLIKGQGKDLMLSADRRGFILLTVTEIPASKVLVNLGLGYYAEMAPEHASKILDEREDQLNKSLQEVTNRLNTSVNAYSQIAEILNRAQQQGE
ncbi:prefoldin subunit alpha [Metallosphaera hakonensis]|nr:prefoldin subunit alpha [Metallosphaera hakonensis]